MPSGSNLRLLIVQLLEFHNEHATLIVCILTSLDGGLTRGAAESNDEIGFYLSIPLPCCDQAKAGLPSL